MKWVLVLIVLEGEIPIVEQGGVYASITDCFKAREQFMHVHLGKRPAQAVCIRKAPDPE